MSWTAPQRSLLNEGPFDSHEIITYKIQRAIERAKELDGWDVFASSREQNKFHDLGDHQTVVARFFEKDVAREWAQDADGDDAKLKEWFDERFSMPCYIVLVTYFSPEYEEPIQEMDEKQRRLQRTSKDDPAQTTQYLMSLLRQGKVDNIRVLAGLGYQPAIELAKQHLPETGSRGDKHASYKYDRRSKWAPGYRIEVALEEGGELGKPLGVWVFTQIIEEVLKHQKEFREYAEPINNFASQVFTNPNHKELRDEIDAALADVNRKYWDQSGRPNEPVLIYRAFHLLGMATVFLEDFKWHLVGNALGAANVSFDLDVENIREQLINKLL